MVLQLFWSNYEKYYSFNEGLNNTTQSDTPVVISRTDLFVQQVIYTPQTDFNKISNDKFDMASKSLCTEDEATEQKARCNHAHSYRKIVSHPDADKKCVYMHLIIIQLC